jgi:hypothetical protein
VSWLHYVRTAQTLGFSLAEIARHGEELREAPDALSALFEQKIKVVAPAWPNSPPCGPNSLCASALDARCGRPANPQETVLAVEISREGFVHEGGGAAGVRGPKSLCRSRSCWAWVLLSPSYSRRFDDFAAYRRGPFDDQQLVLRSLLRRQGAARAYPQRANLFV